MAKPLPGALAEFINNIPLVLNNRLMLLAYILYRRIEVDLEFIKTIISEDELKLLSNLGISISTETKKVRIILGGHLWRIIDFFLENIIKPICNSYDKQHYIVCRLCGLYPAYVVYMTLDILNNIYESLKGNFEDTAMCVNSIKEQLIEAIRNKSKTLQADKLYEYCKDVISRETFDYLLEKLSMTSLFTYIEPIGKILFNPEILNYVDYMLYCNEKHIEILTKEEIQKWISSEA